MKNKKIGKYFAWLMVGLMVITSIAPVYMAFDQYKQSKSMENVEMIESTEDVNADDIEASE